ncbi:MAG: bifunctional 5,10-methylenetetrahydrofolate dehydrogenase/5,10-methenyltetrahydrofolate cyclohydrolase [Clostridiales bacterium]|nr:bifunctional 5,10-methylenetetrahydrofolate dehydrogenase/5,10-methenyltetrahydrofolate cyclohydrolase [Clostridiales bacterium]
MAKLLLGGAVAAALNETTKNRAEALKQRGVTPALCIVRCGEKAADLSYEKGAVKRAEEAGIAVVKRVLPVDVKAEELAAVLDALNEDASVHGVLLLRPLPAHLREVEDDLCNYLAAEKDVDGITDCSAAGVFLGKKRGFAPCTPQACMEILDYYGIDCRGKNAVVIGRSAVVGRPAASLLLRRDATVTVCHTKTKNVAALAKKADIVISAAGVQNSLTANFVGAGQTVVDVSINWDATKNGGKGGITGDADFAAVEPLVAAITPVPGGVGAVTTAVLMRHVVEAAEK